tara:strand:+ start:289 stop:2028 length:1740 start_codon:yes stop_codon:yes gene_type:complete
MSIILGLNCNHADSSACIIKNGKLIFAIEEERINRIKHWAGIPILSIKECLNQTKINPSEITDIAINTNPLSNIRKKTFFFIKNYLFGKKKNEIAQRIKNKINLKKNINQLLGPNKLSENTKIHYIDHHISHISSAFYASKYKKAIGLSIDGFGDFSSLCISKCENENIKVIDRIYFPDSLGLFYEAFTQYIGFKKYGDEYKVMGLSSYGKPKYYNLLSKEIFKSNDSLQLNLKYFNHTNKNFKYNFSGSPNQSLLLNNNIKKLVNFKNINYLNSNFKIKKDMAASIQKLFEKKLMIIIEKIKKLNYSENLVYAGGCALNSLGNKIIYDSKYFKKIFIPYAPGDGGGSIGAALISNKKINKYIKFKNLQTPFLGPEYKNEDIMKKIKKNKNLSKFKYEYYKNKDKLYSVVAKKIFQNKIVGFFNGKMEFGARSLGNRSIIANPCNPKIKDIINLKIKRRENFRPFAPSILHEYKSKWFNNKKLNPYMSAVELIKKNKRKKIPGVTHIDGTGRVQSVTKKLNKDFHLLIKKFNAISKVPILLNTSFNENEPIVMDPDQAIECFLRTKMDILVLNNIIIKR